MKGLIPRHDTVRLVPDRAKGHENPKEMFIFVSADLSVWLCQQENGESWNYPFLSLPHSLSICWHPWDQVCMDTWQIQGMTLLMWIQINWWKSFGWVKRLEMTLQTIWQLLKDGSWGSCRLQNWLHRVYRILAPCQVEADCFISTVVL